jgi:hypothetical protein
MRKSFVLIVVILCSLNVFSQDSGSTTIADTTIPAPVIQKPVVKKPRIIRKDSATIIADSLAKIDSLKRRDSLAQLDSVLSLVKESRPGITVFKRSGDTFRLENNPFFKFTDPMRYSITIKKWQGKEAIFYAIIALLIFFAMIKNGFNRYMADLFKTYFRTAVNQKQSKEQLLQSPLPSLLLNVFFVLSIGMFIALLLQYFKLGLDFNFWWLYFYSVLGLIAIYVVKFISLKFCGWIFQVSESTNSYIFIVFATNKIIGMTLLPFLVMLVFTYGVVYQASMSLSIIVVAALLIYRFFLSYVSIRNQIRISFLHFFLYLLAFEIIPLLLINKLLFSFLGETY